MQRVQNQIRVDTLISGAVAPTDLLAVSACYFVVRFPQRPCNMFEACELESTRDMDGFVQQLFVPD